MNQQRTQWLKEQLKAFEDLKDKCQRPDRVEPIIRAYKEELITNQEDDKYGYKTRGNR